MTDQFTTLNSISAPDSYLVDEEIPCCFGSHQ